MDSVSLNALHHLEMEVMSDLFKRLSSACFTRCMYSEYHSSDLSRAEQLCLDRCVAKYIDAHEYVGRKLTNISQAEQQAFAKMRI